MARTNSSGDLAIDYFNFGGSGPRLLLAHATGFCGAVWTPFAAALVTTFDCWALDFRGHGASENPTDGTFDWQGTADDVLAVIDAIDDGSPEPTPQWFGVGHSMGGASLLLAEQARPGTFEHLWVFEPIIFPDLPELKGASSGGNHLAEGALRRRRTFPSLQAAYDNYSSKPPLGIFDPEALRGYIRGGFVSDPDPDTPEGQVVLACEPTTESEVYRNGGTHHAWDHLGETACPVVVAGGTTETMGPGAFADRIAEALPRGTYEPHPELGHFGPLEAPTQCAESARGSFLSNR